VGLNIFYRTFIKDRLFRLKNQKPEGVKVLALIGIIKNCSSFIFYMRLKKSTKKRGQKKTSSQ